MQYRSSPAQTAPSRTPRELITMMVRRMGSSVYSQALSLSFSDTRVTEGGSISEEEGVEKGDGHPGKTYSGEKGGNFRKTSIHNYTHFKLKNHTIAVVLHVLTYLL